MRSWQERPSVRYPRIFTLVLLVVVALLFYLVGYPSTGDKTDRDIETIIQGQEEQTQKPSVLFSAPRAHLTPVAFEFYVDGEYGDDYNDGHSPTTALKTIQAAQSAVIQSLSRATKPEEVHVYLSGDFPQIKTLQFSSEHSGTGESSRIIYSPSPKSTSTPRIHGGVTISNWKLSDSTKNIWKAVPLKEFTDVRQIYVNGVRATRTSIATKLPGNVKQTKEGYLTDDASVLTWSHPSRLELVYTGSGSSWTEARCGVADIQKRPSDGKILISMKQPCYGHASTRVHNQGVKLPRAVENVFELLGQPGRFYYDATENVIYYTPREGEEMHTATVVVPLVEVLLEAKGLEYVTFSGIEFSYATWLHPSTNDGLPDIQAGCHFLGNPDMDSWVESPANIIFRRSSHIVLQDCVFEHLGATGVAFIEASQHIQILENEFTDISCSALQVGQVTDSAQRNPEEFNGHMAIYQNLIKNVAVEYSGCVGLFAGYLVNTTIAHNDIEELPYTGISLGWGWDAKTSYARDNHILNNKIQNVVLKLSDGGGIYTLGPQPGSKVRGNYIHNVKNLYAGIYHDEGSAFFDTNHNLILEVKEWTRLNYGSAHDLNVHDCFTDQPTFHTDAKKSTIKDTVILQKDPQTWPVQAKAIRDNAGRIIELVPT